MIFNKIRIILVAPSHPGNIGATARAMKNMALTELYLVAPKTFPDKQALILAAGAQDIVENAQVTSSLQEALKGCKLVFATSARVRGLSLPEVSPKETAAIIHAQEDSSDIAILFGRERSGLTNEELLHAHYQIIIAANPIYSSINLAQAVQIISYEIYNANLDLPNLDKEVKLADNQDVERFYVHLYEVMSKVDFIKANKPNKRLWQRIRRLFNRAQLEDEEISILRGFLTKVQKVNRL